MGAIIGWAELVDITRDSPSAWACPGDYHWHIAKPQRLASPHYCRGKLNLWYPGELIVKQLVNPPAPRRRRLQQLNLFEQ